MNFQLLDPPSQAVARLLSGLSEDEKLSRIDQRGKLCSVKVRGLDGRRVNTFESTLGLRCAFMIVGDEFVFFGDNTTYIVHS